MKHICFTSICMVLTACLVVIPALPSFADRAMTFEEAREMALEKVPGTIVDTERSIHNGAVVFEFDIRQENGTVMDIEIDSMTREVLELSVDEVGTGGVLPEAKVEQEDAQKAAIRHVEKNTSGLRGVDVLSSDYTVVNKQVVYVFHVRRGISEYDVTVDANTGRVIDFKEK